MDYMDYKVRKEFFSISKRIKGLLPDIALQVNKIDSAPDCENLIHIVYPFWLAHLKKMDFFR